jgi:hypothetical protein
MSPRGQLHKILARTELLEPSPRELRERRHSGFRARPISTGAWAATVYAVS